MERAFMNDEIGKNREKLLRLLRKLDEMRLKTRKFLTFFDWVRFSRYVAEVEERKRNQIKTKPFQTVNWLVKQRFGFVSNSGNNICNLSTYVLSDTEKFVLSHGLDFCLPPTNVKREKIFAEFEVLMGQLFHHSSKSKECLSALKAKLNRLAHVFCGTQIDLIDFTMHRECFDAIKSLRSNDKIIITKPDKGSGVVILNKSDYISKMNSILNVASKFQQIGPADTNNNTAKIEAKIQRRLLQLLNGGVMHESIYKGNSPNWFTQAQTLWLAKSAQKRCPSSTNFIYGWLIATRFGKIFGSCYWSGFTALLKQLHKRLIHFC